MTKFLTKSETSFGLGVVCIAAGLLNILVGNVFLGVALMAIGVAM